MGSQSPLEKFWDADLNVRHQCSAGRGKGARGGCPGSNILLNWPYVFASGDFGT